MLDNLESQGVSITFSFQMRYCGKLDRNSKDVRHSVHLDDAAPVSIRSVDPEDSIGLFIIIFRHSRQGRNSTKRSFKTRIVTQARPGAKLDAGHGEMAAA